MILQKNFFSDKRLIVGWRRKWIDLKPIQNSQADKIVEKYHYSGKATQNRFLSFGIYKTKESNLLGVIQLGYGIRPKIKETWGVDVTSDNSVEFDRMWFSDELPKFSETIVIHCLCKFLKHNYPKIKYVLSYADGSVGNKGIIYKAANFKSLGSVPCDFYILENGERVHPVSMYHRHGTRAWEFLQKEYPNIKKADGRQYKFIYEIK